MKKTSLLCLVFCCCSLYSSGQAGQLDSSFGTNGILTYLQWSDRYRFTNILVQPDQSFFRIGTIGLRDHFFVNKRHSNGTIDSSYGNKGFSVLANGINASAAALQPDGKIVLAGSTPKSTDFALARFNTDGSLDNTFSDDGIQITNFSNPTSLATSIVIQADGKIIAAGYTGTYYRDEYTRWAIARYNTDGTLDSTFSGDGRQTVELGHSDNRLFSLNTTSNGKIVVAGNSAIGRFNSDGNLDNSFSVDGIQRIDFYGTSASHHDGKIVVAGYDIKNDNYDFTVMRYNSDGSVDSSFSNDGKQTTDLGNQRDLVTSVAIQINGKIIVGGYKGDNIGNFTIVRYNTNGTLDSTFSDDGIQITQPTLTGNELHYITIANSKLYAMGIGSTPSAYQALDIVERYLLDDSTYVTPTVSISKPLNDATFIAPANILSVADANDPNNKITKIEFYNSITLLHTEYKFPYGFVWRNVPLGNYTIIAKAYDKSGLVSTSAAVHISVVPNKPPVVSIATPKNNQAFAVPGYIHFEATAKDIDGRITRVEFYNGSTLLRTEYKAPYTYVWKNVPRGRYTITAIATDNWGAHTTSAPVTVKVVLPPATIVSNKRSLIDDKTSIGNSLSLTLAPNPASGIVNIYTKGLQQDKQVSISVLSFSGIVMKTMVGSSTQNTHLDVSSLKAGVYTLLVKSRDKVLYKRFVKL